ncbi:MAG: hypothetical protein AB1491_03845 [Thermodesulfobacteriota bacterium]
MEQERWLTLSEVIHQTNFNESETRRLVKTFGDYLSGRNFGDIVKYPPATPEVIVLIAKLYRQGWSTDDIREALATAKQEENRCVQDDINQEVGNLVRLQSLSYQLMQATFDMVRDLCAEMAVLTLRLQEAEAEIKHLQEENQGCRAPMGHHKSPLKEII